MVSSCLGPELHLGPHLVVPGRNAERFFAFVVAVLLGPAEPQDVKLLPEEFEVLCCLGPELLLGPHLIAGSRKLLVAVLLGPADHLVGQGPQDIKLLLGEFEVHSSLAVSSSSVNTLLYLVAMLKD